MGNDYEFRQNTPCGVRPVDIDTVHRRRGSRSTSLLMLLLFTSRESVLDNFTNIGSVGSNPGNDGTQPPKVLESVLYQELVIPIITCVTFNHFLNVIVNSFISISHADKGSFILSFPLSMLRCCCQNL